MGLTHTLDEDIIRGEVQILHDTFAMMTSSPKSNLADDLDYLRQMCEKLDPRGSFGDLQRVECSGHCLWTTREGAAEIKESCRTYGFKEALQIQMSLESKMRSQETSIKKLVEDMNRLKFRKDMNLDVPIDDEEDDNVTPKMNSSKPSPSGAFRAKERYERKLAANSGLPSSDAVSGGTFDSNSTAEDQSLD